MEFKLERHLHSCSVSQSDGLEFTLQSSKRISTNNHRYYQTASIQIPTKLSKPPTSKDASEISPLSKKQPVSQKRQLSSTNFLSR